MSCSWLILGQESYIIAQGYISLGQFAGKVNSGLYRVSKDSPSFVDLVSSGNFHKIALCLPLKNQFQAGRLLTSVSS